MASGFFAILDDIATLLDDVAVNSKVAVEKTAGVLGDDLAVNANQASGFAASRELPVIWAITKGSLVNKLIILPVVFLLNVLWPTAIEIILILGGFYLAYEGVEKIIEWVRSLKKKKSHNERKLEVQNEKNEAEKIKAAIKTDFILSLEIVIVALSTVLHQPLFTQIVSVTVVALIATLGVYGLVAFIVKMDDAGYFLQKKSHKGHWLFRVGQVLIVLLPQVIKSLAVIGTVALLMVAGGIFLHHIPSLFSKTQQLPMPEFLWSIVLGILGGVCSFVFVSIFKRWKTVKE